MLAPTTRRWSLRGSARATRRWTATGFALAAVMTAALAGPSLSRADGPGPTTTADFATLLELQARASGLELAPEDVEVPDGLSDNGRVAADELAPGASVA